MAGGLEQGGVAAGRLDQRRHLGLVRPRVGPRPPDAQLRDPGVDGQPGVWQVVLATLDDAAGLPDDEDDTGRCAEYGKPGQGARVDAFREKLVAYPVAGRVASDDSTERRAPPEARKSDQRVRDRPAGRLDERARCDLAVLLWKRVEGQDEVAHGDADSENLRLGAENHAIPGARPRCGQARRPALARPLREPRTRLRRNRSRGR